jgi:hypothetical protein
VARALRYTFRLFSVFALLAVGCQRAGDSATSEGSETSRTVLIEPGPDAADRLQEALIMAQAGDIVELAAGRYDFKATLSLDVENVTIRGAGQDKTILSFKTKVPERAAKAFW